MAKIIKEDFSKQKCGVCHKRFATKYCDFVIQYSESPTFICGRTAFQDFMESQQQLTCDCALCDECAKNHGLIDFCPYHEKNYATRKNKYTRLYKKFTWRNLEEKFRK